MEPLSVVEPEVTEKLGSECVVGVERHAEEPLGLQGMEEGFHVGIVVHLTRAIHALNESMAGEGTTQVDGGVFDAAVGVEVDAVGWSALSDGVMEGLPGKDRVPLAA